MPEPTTKRWVRIRQTIELVYPVDEDAVKAAAERDTITWYAQDIEAGDDSELAQEIQYAIDEPGYAPPEKAPPWVGRICSGYGDGYQEVEIERWCAEHYGSPVIDGVCATCAAGREAGR